MPKFIQIATTTSTIKQAEKISEILIIKRIAACTQILGPIKSTYWWKEKIEISSEWLCLIKSKKSYYKKVEKIILENHSYQTPEIIVIPILKSSSGYSKWLNEVLN